MKLSRARSDQAPAAILGHEALQKFSTLPWKHCLDVGSGPGHHAQALRALGRRVTTLDLHSEADLKLDFSRELTLDGFDAVWCCHTLEHSRSPGVFLDNLRRMKLTTLAITVPPAKHNLVGGHLTLWNEGLLLYNLILAGFDCRHAKVGVYGYNISVILHPVLEVVLPELCHDMGDLEVLSPFFPLEVRQNISGLFGNINWR